MLKGKKIVIVLPAYNAAETLEPTYAEIPMDIVDEVVLVDDASSDRTSALAKEIGINHVITHQHNKGYGGNQKTCYSKALELGADIVVMLHPDYQYTPKLIPSLCDLIASDVYDSVLGSRILGGGALKGGMPKYKYVANRLLTAFQNLMNGQKISEYHTGYRAFSGEVLASLPLSNNSDDFVFDNQMLSQVIYAGYRVGEVACPTKYFPEASSINFRRSVKYGLGVLSTSVKHGLQRMGLFKFKIFKGISKVKR